MTFKLADTEKLELLGCLGDSHQSQVFVEKAENILCLLHRDRIIQAKEKIPKNKRAGKVRKIQSAANRLAAYISDLAFPSNTVDEDGVTVFYAVTEKDMSNHDRRTLSLIEEAQLDIDLYAENVDMPGRYFLNLHKQLKELDARCDYAIKTLNQSDGRDDPWEKKELNRLDREIISAYFEIFDSFPPKTKHGGFHEFMKKIYDLAKVSSNSPYHRYCAEIERQKAAGPAQAN